MTAFDLIVFRAGGKLFGVDATQVERLTLVNRTDPGEAICLSHWLGLSSEVTSPHRTRMTIRHLAGSVQVDVDAVEDVIPQYPVQQVYALPPLIQATKGIRWMWGLTNWRGELVLLVDLDEMDLHPEGIAHIHREAPV